MKAASSSPDNGSETATEDPTAAAPLIIDLGRKKRKQVKDLRKGKGKLVDTVLETLEELKKNNQVSETSQPVIVVVESRRKSLPTLWG